MIGPTSTISSTTATAEAAGQSRLRLKTSHSGLADHQRRRAAEQIGDDEFADRRDEAEHRSRRSTPGSDSGKVTSQKALIGLQPRSAAASSSVSSIFSSAE